MSLQQLERCLVGHGHPGVALFKSKAHVEQTLKEITLTRPGRMMYVPYLEPRRNKFVIVPCKKGDFDSCKFEKPLTETQLRRLSSKAHAIWRKKKIVPIAPEDYVEDAATQMMTDLFRPTVYQPIGRGDKPGGPVPEHYRTDVEIAKKWVQPDRIAQRYSEDNGTKVTESEAWIYLHGTVYKHPFVDKDFHWIYMYLTRKMMEREGAKLPPGTLKEGSIDLTEKEMQKRPHLEPWIPSELTKPQKRKLDSFRSWLYSESLRLMK